MALSRSALLLPFPLVYALAALTFIKVWRPTPEVERAIVWGGLLPVAVVVIACVLPFVLRGPRLRGALALDRHHGLEDGVTNALSFARTSPRTPLMDAAIEDVRPHLDTLNPRRAVPLRVPRDLLLSVALAGAVYGISLLEVRTTRVITEPAASYQPMTLTNDDVELLREWGKELQQNTRDPQVSDAVRKFNQLVEDIAERRLDRRQIFERLEQLDTALALGNEGLEAALDEGLSGIARELEKSGQTKPIADALEEKNLEDAEKAVKELADRLRQKPSKVNKAELERIRKALEAASKQSSERLEAIEKERQEHETGRKKLLDKKKKGEQLSKAEQSKLDQHERQLKHLDRQKKSAEAAQQEMSQLDKDLAKAAQELMKELGEQSSQPFEDIAQDLNRAAQKKLSNEEKEALKKQLEELRQLLRQQKQGGQKRDESLERFQRMARGQQGKGKPGQGQEGQGQKPGQGRGPGRVTLSQGSGQGVELPVPGQGSGQGQGQQQGEGEKAGQSPGSKEWGSSTTDQIQGDSTHLDGQTQDVSAAGIDSGQGDASVEVVYGAAERGFTGRGYRQVYTEYKTVAEEVMTKDEIPPGYKFYVRRYFQLIRPRD